MLSMTGFAQKNVTIDWHDGSKVDFLISLKSVNSRFFEAQCRIPSILSSWETDTIRTLKKRLLRGQIYCTVNAEPTQLKTGLTPSMPMIKQYLDLANSLKQEFKLDSLSINTLLNLPNVFSTSEKELTETEKAIFLEKLENVIDLLILDREREGKNIEADLKQYSRSLQDIISVIEPEAARALREQQAKIENDKTILENLDEKNSALLLLNKLDLSEEISRFKSHLKHFNAVLDSKKDTKGKELDFILQELAREINTIAAKTNSYLISNSAVSAKVELEKAREQVQNIV